MSAGSATDKASESKADSLNGADSADRQEQLSATTDAFSNRPTPNLYTHPSPPNDRTDVTSPTLSPKGNNPAQPFFVEPQRKSPNDITAFPIHPEYQQFPRQGLGHAHNISFQAPSLSSTNGTSSPIRGPQQGYAYQYLPHPQSYPANELQLIQPAFSSHGRDPEPYRYSLQLPHLVGQLPYTSSGTLPDNLPQQRNSFEGGTAAPWEQPHQPAYAPRLNSDALARSSSPSTLKSDEYIVRRSETTDATSPNATSGQVLAGPYLEMQTSMRVHILSNFNRRELSDCHFTLCHMQNCFMATEWFLNTMLISQSPTLDEMLSHFIPGQPFKRLRWETQSPYITPRSVNAALRTCYGEVLEEDVNDSSMDECLEHIVTGSFLGLRQVVLRGLFIASRILTWGNLESAMSFALRNVCGQNHSASAAVVSVRDNEVYIGPDPSYPMHYDDRRPSSCADFTPPSKIDSDSVLRNSPPENRSGSPTEFACELLKICIRYLENNFPADWHFDETARPMADGDRLPFTKNSRSPLSRSRLGNIQFGQIPSEQEKSSSSPDTFISTVLLSVDFYWLKHILKIIGEPVRRNLAAIIEGRERRRHHILQSDDVGGTARMFHDAYRWSEARYEEFIEMKDDGKLTLARRFTKSTGESHSGRSDMTPDTSAEMG